MKSLLHIFQAIPAIAVLEFLRLLPMTWAAAFGAALFRVVGPFLAADGIARRNLTRAFPEIEKTEVDRIVKGVWDNMGRGAGEWARIDLVDTHDPNQVEVLGQEILLDAAANGPFVIVTAHLANWEIGTLVAHQRGIPLTSIYKPPSNPWMDRYVQRRRGAFNKNMIPKQQREGMRRLYRAVQDGHGIGLMADQKLNEGIPVRFFGRDAMTATMPADIAIRWQCPVIPVRYERLPGSRFRVTIEEPLVLPNSGDKEADTTALLQAINGRIESWIQDKPEQWFWVHRRWPDERKRKKGR